MLPSFAIAAEGKTDFPVLKNILIGKFKSEGIEPVVNRHHPEEEGFGNWENVFRYLREAKHRDALENADYLIVQIDTDAADHQNFGVPPREDGQELDDSQIVLRVTAKLQSLICEEDIEFYGGRIIFAICVRELECWLLPLWDTAKAAKTMGCFAALNAALARADEPAINPEAKKPLRYDAISKGYRKKTDLEKEGSRNPSLKIFLTELERCKPLPAVGMNLGVIHPAYFETRFISRDGVDGWPAQFVIITAYATTGETWTDEQNEAADQALEAELRVSGRWLRRVTGYSPTTQHSEPGWAVDLDWEKACDVGMRFLQDAIYVISGDALAVTYCDGRRALVPVGAFLERLTPF